MGTQLPALCGDRARQYNDLTHSGTKWWIENKLSTATELSNVRRFMKNANVTSWF
jgi:hypothetical protein